MASRRRAVLLSGALLVGVACGGGGGNVRTVAVTGTEMRFSPSELTLAPGRYRFHFVNAGTTYHSLGIYPPDGRSLSTREAAAGQSIDLDVVTLKAGAYEMRCLEPVHLQAGMRGTITVAKPS